MRSYEEDSSTQQIIDEAMSCKILGREAEMKLFKEYATADVRRRQEIKTAVIQSNLKFCLKVARAYKKMTGLPLNDFYSEGKLGMLEAFNKFDYRQGIKFGSFAVFEIRRHMDLIVQNSDLIHVPVRMRKRILAARKNGDDISRITYGAMADDAIGEQTSLGTPVSFQDSPGGITVGDLLSSPDSTDGQHDSQSVSDRLTDLMEDYLTAEENSLLRRMYGLDGWEDSVNDIAADSRVGKEYVRRVRSRAIAKLRSLKETDELRNYCGS